MKYTPVGVDIGKRAARTVLTGMCYSVGSARAGEQFADPVYRPVGYDVKDIAEVALAPLRSVCTSRSGCTAALPALLHDPNRRTGSFCGPD